MQKLNLIKPLVKAKAKINLQDKMGRTALHEACLHGHKHVVKYLLKHGSDSKIKDEKGKIAADLVKYFKKLEKLLRKSMRHR